MDIEHIFNKVDNFCKEINEKRADFGLLAKLKRIEIEIEIEKGTKSKIEKEIKRDQNIANHFPRLDLDRLVPIAYPVNYGLILENKIEESIKKEYDDAIIISLHNISYPINIKIPCYKIGEIVLLDEGEQDNKVICIPCSELKYNNDFINANFSLDQILEINYRIKNYLIFINLYKFKENNFLDNTKNKVKVSDFISFLNCND